MVRRKFLQLIAFLAVTASVIFVPISAGRALGFANSACLPSDGILGDCPDVQPAINSGSGDVSLGASNDTPGTPSTYDPSKPVDPSRMTAAERDAWDAARAQYAAENGLPYRDSFVVRTPETAPVTLNDIASFKPAVGTNVMEPNGWMVVGLPTNFYATTGTHVVDGTLLGFPASVRFTPVSWRWTYGDGAATSSSTGGASWAALGLPEFDPTATSHVFATPGTFTIQLTVSFAAEYRFGGPTWVPIAGTLPVAANPITATAGDAQTVLVGRDCNANPGGVGC